MKQTDRFPEASGQTVGLKLHAIKIINSILSMKLKDHMTTL